MILLLLSFSHIFYYEKKFISLFSKVFEVIQAGL